jgi:hypothetical protein
MSKQVNTLSGRLELPEFIECVQTCATAINDYQSTLDTIHALFLSAQLITPPEFEDANRCIHDIGEFCYKFHAFIEESINLPLIVIPVRLPLLIALKNVVLHIIRLNQLFAALREVIWTTLDQSAEQRLLIQHELEELLVGCQEILDRVTNLTNDLRYEKHRSRFSKRPYSVE